MLDLSPDFVGGEVTAIGRKKDSPQYPTSILKFQQASLAPDDRLQGYLTLGDDGVLDVAVDVGQTEIATGVTIGQSRVIEPK